MHLWRLSKRMAVGLTCIPCIMHHNVLIVEGRARTDCCTCYAWTAAWC